MRTLYLRNVPDEVAERLERLASRAGVPLSTFAVRELTEASRRADSVALLEGLPDHGIQLDAITVGLGIERDER